jgi:hypothetical protein
MKRIMNHLFALTLLLTSCKKSILDPVENNINEANITRADLDKYIRQEINTYHKFEWHRASLSMINSALNYSDNMLSVGYTLSSNMDVEKNISSININDAD